MSAVNNTLSDGHGHILFFMSVLYCIVLYVATVKWNLRQQYRLRPLKILFFPAKVSIYSVKK